MDEDRISRLETGLADVVDLVKKQSEINTTLALLVQRVDALTTQMVTISKDHEERLRTTEVAHIKLSERLTAWQIFQTSFTAAVGGAVAFFKP